MSTHPNPHPAPARFDVPETLQALASELEIEGLASSRAAQRPAFTDHFPALIRSSPCTSNLLSDYTDARYYIDRAIPATNSSQSTPLSPRRDTLPGIAQCLTATNLAELPQNTHLLPAGTVVHAFALPTRTGGNVYFFNHRVTTTAAVQLTGAAAGGGKYTGNLLTAPSSAVASGTLSMPEGLAPGSSALILNEEETGQSGHRLAIPSYAVGEIVGINGGQTIVVIRGALGSTSGPTTLTGGGLSPDTSTWTRAANPTPVNVVLQTRTYWDSTAGALYAFQRTLSFDARGLLYAVSPETQITVDVATPCS